MEDWAEIRRLHTAEGLPIKEIALRDAIERDQHTRGDAAQQRSAAGVDVAQAGAHIMAADRLDREGDRRDRERHEADRADVEDPLANVTAGLSNSRDAGRPSDGSPERDEAGAYSDAAAGSYDSAERREAWAAEMEADGLSEDQVLGRMAADRNQATHPRQAVQTEPRTSKARGKGQSQGIQRERGGLSR